ncbi:MAG TPA: DMT family transporter [Egibacteraceae bacterium]
MSPVTARVLLAVTMVLWGLQFVANHELLEVLDATDVIVVRFAGVTLLFGAILAAVPRLRPRFTRRDWLLVVVGSVFAVPGAQLTLVAGQRYLSPAMAGLVVALGPAITALLAGVLLGERLSARKVVGIAIALSGVAVVVLFASGTGTDLTVRNPWGAALVALAQVSWSSYTVLTKSAGGRHHPLTLVAATLIVGAVWLLPFVPATVAALGGLHGWRWLWFLHLVVGGTLLPYLVWSTALRVLPANETASSMFLIPLAAVCWSTVLLHERLSLVGLAGGAAILVGVALTQLGRRRVPADAAAMAEAEV